MTRQTSWFPDWLRRAWPNLHEIVFNSKWLDRLPVLFSVGLLSALSVFMVALVTRRDLFLFYVNDVGHLLLLFAALFIFLPVIDIGRPSVERELNNATDIAVKHFQNWLYLLIVAWLIFYMARFFADLGTVTHSGVALYQRAEYMSPYLNVLSAVPLIGLYVALARRSSSDPGWGIGHRIWVVLGVVAIVWAVQYWAQSQGAIAEARFLADNGQRFLGPNGHVAADLLNGSFIIIPPENMNEIAKALYVANEAYVASGIVSALRVAQDANIVAGIANGVLVGVAQALLVGKLDSGYIRLSTRVVCTLYLYALIQPLFPYVFQNSQSHLRLGMQQAFVAVSLIMKAVLILTLGRLIYIGRLHFYMSNARWLDAHAAILIGRHDEARKVDGRSRARLPLFGFVHPERQAAIFTIEKLDVSIDLALLNSWLGIAWDIRGLSAEQVEFSETTVSVKKFILPGGTLRLEHDRRHASAEVFVEFAITRGKLLKLLEGDERFQTARKLNEHSVVVPFVLKGLKADVAMIEHGGLDYRWMPVEAVNGDALVYTCNVNCDQLQTLDDPA